MTSRSVTPPSMIFLFHGFPELWTCRTLNFPSYDFLEKWPPIYDFPEPWLQRILTSSNYDFAELWTSRLFTLISSFQLSLQTLHLGITKLQWRLHFFIDLTILWLKKINAIKRKLCYKMAVRQNFTAWIVLKSQR